MSHPQRTRAPREDGGLLAVPPLREAAGVLRANRQRLTAWDHDFQGRGFARLQAMVRREVLSEARAFHETHGLELPARSDPGQPLVVTGHQPEPFHPGVWVKNFAVGGLARETSGMGLNLIVDNDLPKSSATRVPTLGPEGLTTVHVPFDADGEELPFEDLPVRDEAVLAAFPDQVRARLGGLVASPVLDAFWPGMVEAARSTRLMGARWALARHRLETSWGLGNWEVPLSAVCETEGFLWFACHLLAHLPRFRDVHNAALAEYRKAHGLRSKHHPVPALGLEGDWLEAPFWVWRSRRPRRRPLMARQRGPVMDLRIAGEDEVLIELPLAPDREACCAVDRLRELPAAGVRLRTRALTTTMFARLLISDLFVHGIGGAKYDELGDQISRAFFGFEPPEFVTLSMTLWLGLPQGDATTADLRAVEHHLRDLEFNPERYLDEATAAALSGALAQRRLALDLPTGTHAERVRRFRAIRAANQVFPPHFDGDRRRLRGQRSAISASLRQNALARGREYPFVLHAMTRLQAVLGALV